jgi:hypothetical protein
MAIGDTLYRLACAISTAEGWFNLDPYVLPRRNNNPGDLKFAGQMNAVKDGEFARFSCPEAGIVALYRQILARAAQGCTLRELIESWAPPNENDTANYLAETVRRMGDIDPDRKLWEYLTLEVMP